MTEQKRVEAASWSGPQWVIEFPFGCSEQSRLDAERALQRLKEEKGMLGVVRKTESRIVDRCPSCGAQSLFVGEGGHLTCGVIGCKEPGVSRAIENERKAALELARTTGDLCAAVSDMPGSQWVEGPLARAEAIIGRKRAANPGMLYVLGTMRCEEVHLYPARTQVMFLSDKLQITFEAGFDGTLRSLKPGDSYIAMLAEAK